ncbi:MAG: LUD domain-containing protein, partial [Phaeodactylibacter sp.]|nr:LUD domain-containing protein [Phaeodactylibacter sp.]
IARTTEGELWGVVPQKGKILKMSKNKILTAIRNNKPSGAPLPDIPLFREADTAPVEAFSAMVETGGGRIVQVSGLSELNTMLPKLFPGAERIASLIPEVDSNVALEQVQSPAELETVDVAVIRGQLGVAENGAVWVTEEDCGHRVLPFITQHLILLLNEDDIVSDMHQAYRQIPIDQSGFGLFIAGPSKTADIEQSLVIGAQGARSLTIFLGTRA